MKSYYLHTCSTCQRILKEVSAATNGVELQDIKTNAITETQLDEMRAMSGSYESLFSRKAMKYRSLGLNNEELNEDDYKKWILKEYTFLKRPVFIIDENIFIGNSKKVVAEVKLILND